MKYTICTRDSFLLDGDQKRKLFDSEEDAMKFMIENKIDASVHGYIDESKMKSVYGWGAFKLFDSGTPVYTKVWGLNWSLCTKTNYNLDDFTCGHFNFYVEA